MKTGFFSLHPISTFLFFVLEFVLLLITQNPFLIGISFVAAFLLKFQSNGSGVFKNLLCLHIPLVLFCGIFNSIFSHYGVTVLFTLFSGNSYTLESLIYGFVFGAKVSIMLLWLDAFNEVITPEKFIYLFGRISPRLALVISMSFRFIPLFRSQLKEISEARAGIGISTKDGNFFARTKAAISNISILITWVLERGIDTADSMSARGYGSGKRSSYSPYKFISLDLVLIIFSVIITAFYAFASESLSCSFNPIIKIPVPDITAVLFLIFFLLLSVFPFVFNLTEKKRWQLSV